ncbi:hypothetical protein LTR97_010783 [Elasticomyces elasticus]|uniref:BTB domain-containing protein n=1 Tax=Elasticomyces elasticus TaxID=574655 RepID=A0AAN7VZ79_9PEZI|nr:hypothetical protein LTR97_010783 [Elasticomyces elasticus]KAK5718647.1 hypothetical protein LTR15_008380 [Elasticomyces elasticus]
MPTKLIHIVPDGDVVLICGNKKDPTTHRICVASTFLSSGSTVFKAMLGENFKEGVALAASFGTAEIPLPDDDAANMIILCRALHVQHDSLPARVQPKELVQLSLIADKYDCVGSLRFASEVWIKHHMDTTNPAKMMKLLAAAYFFRQTELFSKIGRNLILASDGPLLESSEEHIAALETCIVNFKYNAVTADVR